MEAVEEPGIVSKYAFDQTSMLYGFHLMSYEVTETLLLKLLKKMDMF